MPHLDQGKGLTVYRYLRLREMPGGAYTNAYYFEVQTAFQGEKGSKGTFEAFCNASAFSR